MEEAGILYVVYFKSSVLFLLVATIPHHAMFSPLLHIAHRATTVLATVAFLAANC